MRITLTDQDGDRLMNGEVTDSIEDGASWVTASIDAAWSYLRYTGADSITVRIEGPARDRHGRVRPDRDRGPGNPRRVGGRVARETMDDLRKRLREAELLREEAQSEAIRLRAVLSVIRASLNEALPAEEKP